MQKIWYIDDDDSTEMNPNQTKFLDAKELYSVSGVEYFRINVNDPVDMKKLTDLRKARGYNHEDILEVTKETLAKFEGTLKKFLKEHLHEDEEIRLFLEGGGYFDFRDKNDKWIRFKAEKDDLLILPTGIYHRFKLDNRCHAKLLRLFSEIPCWTSYDRPADDHPARVKYFNKIAALG